MKATLLALAVCFAACGGTDEPEPPRAVPLIEWVTDMVSKPDQDPDTVEEKIILDTDNEAEFDSFLVE
jgi:hypothetical protein